MFEALKRTVLLSTTNVLVVKYEKVIFKYTLMGRQASLKLKIKLNDWLLTDTVPKQPIIGLYFEFENELKF